MVPLLVITPYDQREAQNIITSGSELRQNDVGLCQEIIWGKSTDYRGRGKGCGGGARGGVNAGSTVLADSQGIRHLAIFTYNCKQQTYNLNLSYR